MNILSFPGTQEQGAEVLKHLERIMRVKAALLNKESKNRRVPRYLRNSYSLNQNHRESFGILKMG